MLKEALRKLNAPAPEPKTFKEWWAETKEINRKEGEEMSMIKRLVGTVVFAAMLVAGGVGLEKTVWNNEPVKPISPQQQQINDAFVSLFHK